MAKKFIRVRGTQLKQGETKVGNITKITPPAGMKREMTDVSGIEDLYDEFAPGTVDPGTITVRGNMGDPTLYSVLMDNFNQDDVVAWTITYPDGSTHSFNGAVQDAGWDEGDRKGVYTYSVTIKISGGITYNAGS